jgi:hypothetical protein
MSHWLGALIILVVFMLARGLAMTYLAVRVRRAHALMHRYWSDEVAYEAIGYRKSDIVRLLRGAQVTAPRVPRAQPIGYMQIQTGHFDVFDNLFRKDADIALLVNDALMTAEGYYRDEARRSFVPVFWPSVLAHLPSDVLVYIGVSPESAATRASTVIGWSATVLGAVAVVASAVSR